MLDKMNFIHPSSGLKRGEKKKNKFFETVNG